MGFFSGLNAEKYDRQYSNRDLIKRIIVYAKPFIRQLIIILFVVILRSLFETAPPLLVSKLLDTINKTSASFNFILLLSLVILGLGVLSYLLNYIRMRMMVRVISELIRKLATDAFTATTRQDLSFHDSFSSGKIVSRITSDTRDFGQLISMTTDVFTQLLQSIIVAIILITTEWRLSLILFSIIPIIVVFMLRFRVVARKVTRQGMRAMANVNSTIKETISGISIAKNFRQELSILNTFKESNQTSYKVNIRRGLILSIVFPTMRTLGGIMAGILVYFGSGSVIDGIVTAGAWYLFLLSLDRLLMPILSITSYWTQVQSGLSAAERIFALIDAKHSVIQIGNKYPKELSGKIDFTNLNFGYTDSSPILSNFDLHVRAGENIAIVGHTGAGKTTIARLITRFYEFQSGELTIDDQNIRSFNLEALRKKMGIVSQVPFLFDGSIAENISFAKPEVSLPDMVELANEIGEGEWVETLPRGFNTQVGERGSQLSMGQRQLVALMRVLIQKPAIFILDEATASIDPFTEKQIQTALNLILRNSTSILIAHRLSTVKSADRIIVMKEGRIIEEGNHQSLLDKSGYYAELYNTYFRHQSLQYIEESYKLVD
ncbi:MAG: ABC transporter ATP-binding protein/permease [Anaerolineaceae bacterium]|nr:ABC transporter ATP-binding protein/permease [Anaerolineaceae bacterium]